MTKASPPPNKSIISPPPSPPPYPSSSHVSSTSSKSEEVTTETTTTTTTTKSSQSQSQSQEPQPKKSDTKAPAQLGQVWSTTSTSAASVAYQSNEIRTSSSGIKKQQNAAIRIAFRNDTNETLTLCWISPHCKPFHFYALKPRGDGGGLLVDEKDDGGDSDFMLARDDDGGDDVEEEAEKKNIKDKTVNNNNNNNNNHNHKSSNQKKEQKESSSILTITKNDHMEKTFLGHAFIVARHHPRYHFLLKEKENDEVKIQKNSNSPVFKKTKLRKDEHDKKEKEEEGKVKKGLGGEEVQGNLRGSKSNQEEEEDKEEEKGSNDETSIDTDQQEEDKKEKPNEKKEEEEEEQTENGHESNLESNKNETKKADNARQQQQQQQQQERHLDPKNVIGGYRPTSLTLNEKVKSINDRHFHLVTVTRRRRRCLISTPNVKSVNDDNNHDVSDSKMEIDEHNNENQMIKETIKTTTTTTAATIKNEKQQENDNDDEFEYILTIKEGCLDPTPIDTSNKVYKEEELGGWPVRCEPGWDLCDDANDHNDKNSNNNNNNRRRHRRYCDSNGLTLRERLANDIHLATSFLPDEAREKLRKSTPVWINKSQQYGPKAAPVTGRGMCFHPGKDWLLENGMSEHKCHGIELYNSSGYLNDVELWGPGGNMLHEFCHAYHATCIPGGYDNPDVIKAYREAMEKKLYDCVDVHGSQGPKCRAYACTDPMEYFAELSTAFLGTREGEEREFNKWFPFNRDQIRSHDPGAFEMLTKTWNLLSHNSSSSVK